jgi:hypothetical protein
VLLALASLWLEPALEGAQGFSLAGTVWYDENYDGTRQESEAGVPRVQVSLVGGSGQVTTTDAQGRYRFEDLTSTSYRLRLSPQVVVVGATYPARITQGYVEAAVSLSGSVSSFDFGVVLSADLLRIAASVWLDAAPIADAAVRAFIGGVDCTLTPVEPMLRPPHSRENEYRFYVAPEGLVPGCGRPGAPVMFSVNGVPANETVAWRETGGEPSQQLSITAGPPFAVYYGEIWPEFKAAPHDPDWQVEAYINDRLCSDVRLFAAFELVVYSDEQRPGCGVEGAPIEFRVNGVASAVDSMRWQAGFHTNLDLRPLAVGAGPAPTAAPGASTPGSFIQPPDVGSGGLMNQD